MHRCSALLLLVLSLPAMAAAEPPSFPYKAYINTDGVYIRSGPGNNYYPTDKLDSGAEVEVYRHDPGGWYAIKPPEGSFTWVASRYLQPGSDHLAAVTGDRVAARVGSRFSDIRDVIGVRLDRGEQVEVLETKTMAGDPESPTWCKIAPPSGEFRWVFGKFVDPDHMQSGVRKVSAEANPLLPQTSASQGAVAVATASASAMAGQPVPRTAASAADQVARTAQADPDNSQPPAMRHLSPEEFQTELDRLNLELSTMLVEEPTVWECDGLALRGEELLAQAQTAIERGRTRLLVNRIHQAQDIKKRYDAIQTAQVDTQRQNRLLADLSLVRSSSGEDSGPSTAGKIATSAGPNAGQVRVPTTGRNGSQSPTRQTAERRFDGMGRLTRVVPSKLGAPQYALVDDKGGVRCYITPAPGVNLQYYVGRRVGINGVRGYMPEQKAPHVTAKYVTSLDRSKLR